MRATNLRYTPKSRMKAGLHLTGKAALSPSVKAKLPLPNRGEPQADRLFQRAPESKKKSSVSIVSFLPGFVNKKKPVVRIFSIGSRKRKAVRRENRIGQKKRGPQENDKNSEKQASRLDGITKKCYNIKIKYYFKSIKRTAVIPQIQRGEWDVFPPQKVFLIWQFCRFKADILQTQCFYGIFSAAGPEKRYCRAGIESGLPGADGPLKKDLLVPWCSPPPNCGRI